MSSHEPAIEKAAALMASFAERTGLTSERPKRRYLWTDAFAVCNLVGLAHLTGERAHMDLALRLVDQVHQVLGRYRADDTRSGWISGLDHARGESHPTRGGLRIGKALLERRPDEPFDRGLEWERDGQYFHYLTKWMHALDQIAAATREPRFNVWARELAEAAHAAFVYRSRAHGGCRMVWKMSTDLSRPLVASMGQHDPLDGLITYTQLETTAALLSRPFGEPASFKFAIADFVAMTEAADLRTEDPLGLGGLLGDAWRVAQLMARGAFADGRLGGRLLAAAHEGLLQYSQHGDWREPASRRLAFRELGLAIGLSGIERLRAKAGSDREDGCGPDEMRARVQPLVAHGGLRASIVSFWLDAEHQRVRTWSEHRDINEVMLATALVPEGFLTLSSPDLRA